LAVIFFPESDSVNNAERERLTVRLDTPSERGKQFLELRRKLIGIALWREMVLLSLNEPSPR
jgi:hypothetical protein